MRKSQLKRKKCIGYRWLEIKKEIGYDITWLVDFPLEYNS